jgi:hypothetical protein
MGLCDNPSVTNKLLQKGRNKSVLAYGHSDMNIRYHIVVRGSYWPVTLVGIFSEFFNSRSILHTIPRLVTFLPLSS